jgi:hydrogenase maturation protein HypF
MTRTGIAKGTRAVAVEVRGVVQGVGFRPFVWRLARRHEVGGWVRNRDGTVEILAEGRAEALDAFTAAIARDAPPLARVDSIVTRPAQPAGLTSFAVEASAAEGREVGGLVPPDVVTCDECLAELLDPGDRRFRYPFVNCTNCGPRFTIIESLPYDRERTSMSAFPLCPACAREYGDPSDRRFHAEPVACAECGPRLSLVDAEGRPHPVLEREPDPVRAVAGFLREGAIVAVKGLGGFHLACDATNEAVVAELRRRKRRPAKPFAVMVATLEEARRWFDPTPDEVAVLASAAGPIVLVRDRGLLARSVARGHRRQGAMLPSTPLHHLLLREAGRPLVMTSGNLSDEPIRTGNDEAVETLRSVADAFLLHDRGIVARYDDSVTAVWRGAPVVLRRARGLAPAPLRLAQWVAPTLGVGAELHAAFCLAGGDRAFLGQHVGDLDSEETLAAYRAALDRYRTLFAIEPEMVAHDLHPDFASTRLAESLGLPAVAVQHHHAHVAAVMAEHGLPGPVLGVAFDGFGLGEDGTSWGGEFLVCDAVRATRVGHLRPVRQPGGDAAVRRPLRMALAHAADAGVLDSILPWVSGDGRAGGLTAGERDVALAQVESGMASPFTSSAGRLFDAVAALAGLCGRATYDGQPAMLLEQAADPSATGAYPIEVTRVSGRLVVDTRPLIAAVASDLRAGEGAGAVSARFHRAVAAAIGRACLMARDDGGPNQVCLAGGVFQNDVLRADTVERLERSNFQVFFPRLAPPGDGGLSLGQVLVAHGRREAGLAPDGR